MKLELKHLAAYLPYNLRGFDIGNTVKTVHGIEGNEVKFEHTSIFIDVFLPVLHPISDLTKEIEINGKIIIPIVELAKLFHRSNYPVTNYLNSGYNGLSYHVECYVDNDKSRYMFYIINPDIEKNKWEEVEKLLEWHFDIFGLIDAGLAIDINTI